MTSTNATSDRLKQYIERIEKLTEEKQAYASDISDIYAEAKSAGFEVKAIRQIVKLRAMDAQKRAELEENTELYKGALGML